jgi:hypothetical protein
LDADQLRFLLREHALVLEPGEVLVVCVPPGLAAMAVQGPV